MEQHFLKNDMKKKDALIIIILLFTFVFGWIVTNIYHSATKSTISEDISKNIVPIDPIFDNNSINKLKQRHGVNPSFELQNPTPTPQIISPPTASQEGEVAL